MDEADKEEPWISRNLGRLLWGIVAIAVIAATVAASVYFAHLGGLPISDSDPAGWGQLGDYFGGLLNPVFSFLTILALVLTLILQSRELKLSREELELSRTELRNSAEALRGQNKAIDRQSFEQTFFAWLATYSGVLSTIEYSPHGILVKDRRALANLWDQRFGLDFWNSAPLHLLLRNTPKTQSELREMYANLPHEKCGAISAIVLREWESLYLEIERIADNLFRVLYRLIVWIDSQDEDRLSPAQKWLYVSIVRAQLSWIELVYLFYNGHTERGRNFKRLAEKYALFDNLNFATDPVIAIVKECPPDSVGYQPSAYDSRLARVAMGLPESSEQTLAMASDH